MIQYALYDAAGFILVWGIAATHSEVEAMAAKRGLRIYWGPADSGRFRIVDGERVLLGSPAQPEQVVKSVGEPAR